MLLIEQRLYQQLIADVARAIPALQRDAAVVSRTTACNRSPVWPASAATPAPS